MERHDLGDGKYSLVINDEEFATLKSALDDYKAAKERKEEFWRTVFRTLTTAAVVGVLGIFGAGIWAYVREKLQIK